MNNRHDFTFLGVKIFSWSGWNQGGDEGEIFFYDPIFFAESMEYFNEKVERTVFFSTDGSIELSYLDLEDVDCDEHGCVNKRMYIDEIPEVWEAIKKRH